MVNTLLDEAYLSLKERVDPLLVEAESINIIFDETMDIKHNHILNLFFMTTRGPLFIEYIRLGHTTINSDWLTKHLSKRLHILLNGNVYKVFSFSIDTYLVIEAT